MLAGNCVPEPSNGALASRTSCLAAAPWGQLYSVQTFAGEETVGLLISAAKETGFCRELWALGECIKVCAVREQDTGLMYVVFGDSEPGKSRH